MTDDEPVRRHEECRQIRCGRCHCSKQATRLSSTRMKQLNQIFRIIMPQVMMTVLLLLVSRQTVVGEQVQQARPASFPGVSRDIASFCAARPSLPVDLAAMIVHVKKNISFNYKLYLFSADHVFQTGQVIPRDDFRIHSFPVKLKSLNEFWPTNVATSQFVGPNLENSITVPSSHFNLKQFMSAVPMIPQVAARKPPKGSQTQKRRRERNRIAASSRARASPAPEELQSDGLPGDASFISHDVARVVEARSARDQSDQRENLNKHIQFDRDDQLSVSRRFYSADYLSSAEGVAADVENAPESDELESGEADKSAEAPEGAQLQDAKKLYGEYAGDAVVPVSSFSSFHVNQTYLVRKDFGQLQPQLVRIHIDANQFVVDQLYLISNGSAQDANSEYPKHEDYNFLSHKLLRDPNTRITSINQIYEDWITRNFYTVVYIQRRSDAAGAGEKDEQPAIVNDRLVFRGTSIALLGADQLDYSVKAAAFITEKNGLHYYLEFITTGKFYLCAVDWTKRPFKMIDSTRFPIKATMTQFDNEELLLCPPAMCYSSEPIDEIVGYGRVTLPERIQREARILSKSLFASSTPPVTLINLPASDEVEGVPSPPVPLNETTLIYNKQRESLAGNRLRGREALVSKAEPLVDGAISLDSVIEAVRAGSSQLQTRLHLRDWVWTLARLGGLRRTGSRPGNGSAADVEAPNGSKAQQTAAANASFEWRHELARRNDIKVKPDTYGYVLTGHQIDASYRVYNELYLISANHLIAINYTMSNETVISTHPIGDEFLGLSSTLLDPITGAFYDRYANQIYFFKGDRYIGYDYASKKALAEFLLESPIDSMAASGLPGDTSGGVPLVSSLPVVEILGRQHQVDGVYHDFLTDLVYIFSGMKFYIFGANEFKNGSFKPEAKSLPKMYCINEHFLHGCNFDAAYKNPCRVDEDAKQAANRSAKLEVTPDLKTGNNNDTNRFDSTNDLNFSDEQQMKLRTIASRAGLLNILVENTLLNKGAARAIGPLINGATSASGPAQSSSLAEAERQSESKIVVYLLMAMIVLTVLVTMAVILVIINWTRVKFANQGEREAKVPEAEPQRVDPQPGRQYLSNQHHHSRSRQHHNGRHTSRGSSIQTDRSITVKPLDSIGVVKSSRRQGGINNSAL